MSRRPSTYAHASKLSAEAQSCLDFARLVWLGLADPSRDGLSPMQEALRSASLGPTAILASVRAPTIAALARRGLTYSASSRLLTPLGELVREAGIKSRMLRLTATRAR
jgi:hypothetical protein